MTADPVLLAAELEALTELLYVTPTGVAQIDASGKIGFINPLAVQLLMPLVRSGDDLCNLFESLSPVAPDLRQAVQDFKGEHGDILRDARIVVSAGSLRHPDVIVYAISLVKLDEARIMVSLQDISESVHRERLLRQQEAWINAVMLGITDHAIILLDLQGAIIHWNEGAQRLTGFASSEVLGRPCALLFAPDVALNDRLLDRLQESSMNGLSLDECRMTKADGTHYLGHSVIIPVAPGLTPDGYAMVIRNITNQRQSMSSLLHAATRDQLTDLANRRSFFEALEIEVTRYRRRSRQLSLLLIDIDRFKQINDAHGHPVGDAVIRDLARVMSTSVREFDGVGRIGGEEFAVLLPSTAPEAAHAVAERIRQMVEQREVEAGGVSVPYTISIGIAAMHRDFAGPASLVEAADRALYAAKRAGRNRVCMA